MFKLRHAIEGWYQLCKILNHYLTYCCLSIIEHFYCYLGLDKAYKN